MKKLFLSILIFTISSSVSASRFWTGSLENWDLYLNNGTVYVSSTSFPDECTYNRAQLDLTNDEYVKGLFAYILAASKTGEGLDVVLDHNRSSAADSITCKVLSANSL